MATYDESESSVIDALNEILKYHCATRPALKRNAKDQIASLEASSGEDYWTHYKNIERAESFIRRSKKRYSIGDMEAPT